MDKYRVLRLNRRELLKWGGAAVLGGVADLRPRAAFGEERKLLCEEMPELSPCPVEDPLELTEFYPTSPFILEPFKDPLVIPPPLRPVSLSDFTRGGLDGPDRGRQASDGGTHQIWPTDLRLPEPVLYRIDLLVRPKNFTTSKVLPIDAFGNEVACPKDGAPGQHSLPSSTMWMFNETFPGPMINAEYDRPVLVRFVNRLNEEDYGLDSGDFGAPCRQSLVHLHNGHTAPESDGNPNFKFEGYFPTQWVDNLYLNFPPGKDERERRSEKQSFLWYHDHFEGYTGANVYKGLVGIYPIYDPDLDPGDEKSPGRYGNALRLPGVRKDNTSERTFKVEYDIPLVFYDCRLNDGVTPHKDFHNGCGETKPESWGTTFFRHFPDGGFVGDVFTVNGTAYPVLEVKRRKYRFRLLDASIARIYEFKLMSSSGGPKAAPGAQGQWTLPDGEQSMRFTQIASEGGLLPFPRFRNSIELWPSKRREVVIDFTKYLDGSPTTKGDVIYLVNVLAMPDGRKQSRDELDRDFRVPVLKFVIGDIAEDNSQVPSCLRPLPDIDLNVPRQRFDLERGGLSGGLSALLPGGENINKVHPELKETEWLINGRPFLHEVPLAFPRKDQPEIWIVKNHGGGWVHPMHFHQEEHQVLSVNGVNIPRERCGGSVTDERLAEYMGKEDTVPLAPNDEFVIYRNFRTFPAEGFREAKYVAHCHNLAHEDHTMMFGWTIVPKSQA